MNSQNITLGFKRDEEDGGNVGQSYMMLKLLRVYAVRHSSYDSTQLLNSFVKVFFLRV